VLVDEVAKIQDMARGFNPYCSHCCIKVRNYNDHMCGGKQVAIAKGLEPMRETTQ